MGMFIYLFFISLFVESIICSTDDTVDVYFGLGCFWHMQHEFIEAERSLLNRTDAELTAVTGYAGGTKVGWNGELCYHTWINALGDYGSLGHGEVVGLTIPKDQFKDFAAVYFSEFVDGTRRDYMDVGAEYRHLVGIPGGINSDLYYEFIDAQDESGKNISILEGLGNDADNLNT